MKLATHKRELQQIVEAVAEEELVEDELVWSPIVRKEDPKPISFPKIATEVPKKHTKALTARLHRDRSKSANLSFHMLKSFPGVTNHLITDADRAVFLKKKRSSQIKSCSPEQRTLESPRGLLPRLKGAANTSSLGLHPSILEKMKRHPRSKSKSARRENLSSSSSSVREINDSSDTESAHSRSQQQSSRMSRIRHGRMKHKFASSLDKNNDALKLIFKRICRHGERGFKKVTNASFESFLAVRYPEAFTASLSKYFAFGEGVSLEGYISEFEKFLSLSDEKLLHFVFEAFDFNRDHYICYTDTFLMISYRKADTYDLDLVKLRQMFYLKKSRNAPGRKGQAGRRGSFYNGGTFDEDESKLKRKRVPYYNLDRPEALTFEDFSRVEFGGRPQFLWDFLKYTCSINSQEGSSFINVYLSRQNTEEFLAEASLSSVSLSLLAKDERASYFKELVRCR